MNTDEIDRARDLCDELREIERQAYQAYSGIRDALNNPDLDALCGEYGGDDPETTADYDDARRELGDAMRAASNSLRGPMGSIQVADELDGLADG